ncbi:UDP-N-acetylmuramate dehydrogenase [Saccharicrinis sp. FJH62]|uniref:UDP-N-acetylmuramate dehydrogenase n=1 Tax=Saccharicrinis sp. FJH62 TaxID=3344657 RepID=UPI0035D4FB2E
MLHRKFSLKQYNTFGLDVTANYFFEYEAVHDLVDFLSETDLKSHPVFFLGGGSNVLFTKNFDGLILHSRIEGKEIVYEDHDNVYVRVGAGEDWDEFVGWCVENEYGGVENLSLIPGHVGASPVQNIGAYGVEAKDVIDVVEAVNFNTGKISKFLNEECEFGYRDSIFKNALKDKFIVTRVTFKLSKKPGFVLNYGNVSNYLKEKYGEPTLQNIRQSIIEIRESKLPDPEKTGNAGSFFKNPVVSDDIFSVLKEQNPDIPSYEVENGFKIPAAWLIDQCNLKGYKIGGAQVHDKQPLVIINTGKATADDIVALSDHVRQKVKDNFGITLHQEVIFIG